MLLVAVPLTVSRGRVVGFVSGADVDVVVLVVVVLLVWQVYGVTRVGHVNSLDVVLWCASVWSCRPVCKGRFLFLEMLS